MVYKIKQTKNTEKFQKITVNLYDQFENDAIYTVKKTYRLYNPVDKNGEIKPDTPNGYYYDEKGNLSIVKDGVKSDIKFKAKE